MKKYFFLFIGITFLLSSCGSDYSTANFKVWGNCSMCKERIEESLMSQEGVKSAEWDVKSKMVEVKYDSAAVNLSAIHKNIASVGHDTELLIGEDKAYNDLHSCCKYKRK